MAVEATRWGILYCPRKRLVGNRKYRERVLRALENNDVKYDFVQCENSGSVERLVRMFINNGYKTIIVVGGDSALNDAANCLMDIEIHERNEIVLGVIPNGVMNDFARFWNFRESDIEQTVKWLVKHRVRKIDLGCVRYMNKKGEKCHQYFLNCINIGLIADIMNLRKQTRSILGSRMLSFLVSLVLMIFHRLEYKMHVKINSEELNRKVMTLCVGSGPGYGQTPNAVPYNGLLDVSVVYHPGIVQMFAGIWLLLTGRFLNHRSVHPYRTSEVSIVSAKHALVGVDGRLIATPVGAYKVTVEQEVINFLIPD
ncbi:diacylglycerol/lipid kinase family protein [Xylanibacter muris]|uniref:Lipid kinase n=1 Tax=Xylanibacter muris TaxID=2736290 RepID=A0ABX2AST1_9BACT|nr:diacylglycerol kinase family protein [Xylanibacter muris]NPD93254.1 lipid kinase [Xylanibacter muris]